ncbi:MAG: class I poly(R)-hydroxyalkanoic acid synthase, partial [Oricola sp.]|nr:class I poly(R)-hydroxyalkanoic acid synthase [Oricola sp.]
MKEQSGKKSPAKKKKKAKKAAGKAPDSTEKGPKKESAAKPEPKTGDSSHHLRSIYEDFDALSEYLADVGGKSQEVLREFVARNQDVRNFTADPDPLNIGEAFQEMLKGLSIDPGLVMQRQFTLWGDYAKLMGNMSRRMAGETVKPAIEPDKGDKRFAHPAWNDNPMLDFVKQSYLIFARWLEKTIAELEFEDEHEKKKAEFFTRQFIDAFAPSNFAMLNPEVIEATLESKGENLLKGLRNLLDDIDRGHGQLAIRQADLDFFKLGENIATTPGKVVFQNEIFQLIQYAPTTETVASTPMLIIPPWINKFYILDLQPQNSFIHWLVSQGRTVFVMSWVNPGPELKDKTFEDYIKQGFFKALDAVGKATGEKKADVIGYCIGGTMLS